MWGFQAVDATNIFVLGMDGNLWWEIGTYQNRTLVDATTIAFQPSNTALFFVYVLGSDGKLWKEQLNALTPISNAPAPPPFAVFSTPKPVPGKESKESKDGKDGKEGKDGKDGKDGKEGKDGKDDQAKENKDLKEASENYDKTLKEQKEASEGNKEDQDNKVEQDTTLLRDAEVHAIATDMTGTDFRSDSTTQSRTRPTSHLGPVSRGLTRAAVTGRPDRREVGRPGRGPPRACFARSRALHRPARRALRRPHLHDSRNRRFEFG